MWDIGDTVPLAVEIRDAGNVLTNATTVTLTITLPDGTTVTPAVTNPPAVTGKYSVGYVPAQTGRYHYEWKSTGPVTAYADMFDVRSVSVGIVSLADVREYLHIPDDDHELDEELRGLIGAATAVIEHVIGSVIAVPRTETWSGGRRAIVLVNHPVLSITSVTQNGQAVPQATGSGTGWSLSDTGILYRVSGYGDLGWLAGRNNIVIQLVAGRAETPLSAAWAALELIRINARPVQGGNYGPFNSPEAATEGGAWALGWFVPRGVRALLQPEADPGGIY